ncbi:MAG: amidase family protein, partial [Pseudomonadota bacterium]
MPDATHEALPIMTPDPWSLSARKLAAHVRAGVISAEAVTAATLERIHSTNCTVNAIVSDTERDAEQALGRARAIDRRRADGVPLGALAGVPATIKVIADQEGEATTNGTTLAKDLIATRDAPFVAQMRQEDVVFVGRTNTPAFSYRWFTSNIIHGTTLNPH